MLPEASSTATYAVCAPGIITSGCAMSSAHSAKHSTCSASRIARRARRAGSMRIKKRSESRHRYALGTVRCAYRRRMKCAASSASTPSSAHSPAG